MLKQELPQPILWLGQQGRGQPPIPLLLLFLRPLVHSLLERKNSQARAQLPICLPTAYYAPILDVRFQNLHLNMEMTDLYSLFSLSLFPRVFFNKGRGTPIDWRLRKAIRLPLCPRLADYPISVLPVNRKTE